MRVLAARRSTYGCLIIFALATSGVGLCHAQPESVASDYFPPPESKGGWRKLSDPDLIGKRAGMDPDRLAKLRAWLCNSDRRDFAAVVIRRGFIVLEEERGISAVSNSRRIASCSKAICATVLAIASEQSQQGRMPLL